MISFDEILIVAAVLLLFGVLASKASSRFGVPALLLFLAIGILAGSEGLGGIPFDNAYVAQSTGVIALAFILFAGGLDTDWSAVSPVFWRGMSLATIGVGVTALLVGWFATRLFGIPWLEGLLLGSIVSSTDAAAVFSVLRSQGISLKDRIQPLLELESGSNDPMAAFLTIGLVHLLITRGESVWYLPVLFLRQMLIGALLGYAIGRLAVWVINRLKLDAEGLYAALTVAIVLLTYGAAAALGGSGFLAVYLAGVVMGNQDFVHRRSLTRFHDGVAWLMQIVVFLVLGLLVFPSRLRAVMGVAVLMALFLVLIARPVSVFVSLAFARLGMRQKVLISWVGLRGAVPIVLATFPLLAKIPQSQFYFDVVFFTVVISVLLQGTTIAWVARTLGLQNSSEGRMRGEPARVAVAAGSRAAEKQVVELGFPRGAHLMLVTRGDEHLVPNGSTTLRSGDELLVLAHGEDLARVRRLLEEQQK